MILNELLQVSKIKYYARAPLNREVEELTSKDMVRCLQNKRLISDLVKERKNREERSNKNNNSRGSSSSRYSQSRQRGVRERSNRDRRDSNRDSRFSRPGQRSRSGPRDSSRERFSKPKISIPKDKIEPLVKEIISSNEAVALDDKFEQISRTSNVKIFDELNPTMKTVVFDGVVTQRFLDHAIKNQVKHIVAVNINKYLKVTNPSAIELYYFSDFL